MHHYLVWFVEQALGLSLAAPHPLEELVFGAGTELVGLDALLPNDRGPHDAPVPVGAGAVVGHAQAGGHNSPPQVSGVVAQPKVVTWSHLGQFFNLAGLFAAHRVTL